MKIDHEHYRAICDEVGDRLRTILNREASELSPRMILLLNRLAEMECDTAPSVVPSMLASGQYRGEFTRAA
jgi:hypothetical protein